MKKKSIVLIIIGVIAFLLAVIIALFSYFNINLDAVDKSAEANIKFVVNPGESAYQTIANLKKEGLIRDENVAKFYFKFNNLRVQAGTYVFSKAMNTIEIFEALNNGDVTNETVWITFVEGKRLTYMVKKIAESFDYTEEEIIDTISDLTYLKELISKYDILTDDILNQDIYYSLEGYLFPDTYEFLKDASIKEIIEKMISTMESKVSAYQDTIDGSSLSIHEIMTLSSIVELEGARSDDRAGVAAVFYNRLKAGMSLGSDVTTYYAVGKNFDVDLSQKDLDSCNGYNTRGTCVKGLPIGPIASPSMESIKAVLNPEENTYYYFVADKTGKTYFSKTYSEFVTTINKLKSTGMWYEY